MAGRLTRRFSTGRRWALAGVALLVCTTHLGVAEFIAREHAERFDLAEHPTRMSVLYVREMELSVPKATAAPPARARPRRPHAHKPPVATPPEVAQAAEPAASDPPPEPVVSASAPVAQPPVAAASEPASTPQAAAVPPFEWPVSTRLRYALTGYVRGEVYGQAQVEWIREGDHYQVHLDVEIGPSIAPLAARRMSSDGVITAQGLRPRDYDQTTRFGFAAPHRTGVRFDDEQVLLATGHLLPRLPGLQDTASQFVQLSWLFDSEPTRLKVGESVPMPLALPRRVSVWVYDVVGEELLYTPFGEVPSFHIKPRIAPGTTGDLVTEVWIAPGLRHLPVRFRIHQDAENYVDLMLDRRPQLAAKM